MIDWKVLASAFIALLIVSFLLVDGLSTGGILSGVFGALGTWFGSSPFGDFVPNGHINKQVTIAVFPDNLTIETNGAVEIGTDTLDMSGFDGTLDMDFKNNIVTLAEKGSALKINLTLEGLIIPLIKINKISLTGIEFSIQPNVTTNDGEIDFSGFSGSLNANSGGLEFSGNVTELSGKIGDLNLDMG